MKKTIFSLGMALFATFASGQVVINEVLADPAGDLTGDANGDGVRDQSDDEFVEFVNVTGTTLDLDGWSISDGFGIRHTFTGETLVSSGQAVVVFGGGSPTGDFGGALVATASTGALGLNNAGDTVTIFDAASQVVTDFSYGSEGGNDQSLTRDPDLTGEFVRHMTLGDGSLRFSPGFLNDGTPFGGNRLFLTIDPASFLESAGGSAATGTITRTGDTSGEILVNLSSSDATELTVPSVVAILAGQATAVFAVSAVDELDQDGDQEVTVTASADDYFGGSFKATVLDNEAPVPVVTLTAVPSEISENGGTSTITVEVNVARPAGYSLALSVDDPSELGVPASVSIPANATTATFTATAVDDMDVDGEQFVTITATDLLGGVAPATVVIRVDDDEVPVIGDVIAYWNQNSNANEFGLNGFGFTTSSFPQAADVGTGSLTLADFDETVGQGDVYQSIQSFSGTAENGLPEVPSGGSLSPQGGPDTANNGMSIVFQVSTLGRTGIVVSWAQRGTSTGFSSRKFEWSLNQTDWTEIGEDTGTLPATWSTQTYNLSGTPAVEGHEAVYFRIVLNGATGDGGNNRFDNILFTSGEGGGGPNMSGLTTVSFKPNGTTGNVQWQVRGLGSKIWILQGSRDLGQGQMWSAVPGGYSEVDQPDGSVMLNFFDPEITDGAPKRFYRLIEAQ